MWVDILKILRKITQLRIEMIKLNVKNKFEKVGLIWIPENVT